MNERIETAAAELGSSVGFFVLAFRGALGTTPHHYLMKRRLACPRRADLDCEADRARRAGVRSRRPGASDEAHAHGSRHEPGCIPAAKPSVIAGAA
ncbi:MAG: hypothetical protein ACRYG8_16315 [Janthinobacterium lividum]